MIIILNDGCVRITLDTHYRRAVSVVVTVLPNEEIEIGRSFTT